MFHEHQSARETPARNEDMPDLFRYPETSDTSTPRIPPTGVLEAITAIAAKAPKAIRPDANGDSNFHRFIMRFFCNSNGRCWPSTADLIYTLQP